MFNKVLFPEPEGPMIAADSPALSIKVMSRRMTNSRLRVGKDLQIDSALSVVRKADPTGVGMTVIC
jgi:hypothetical protein